MYIQPCVYVQCHNEDHTVENFTSFVFGVL